MQDDSVPPMPEPDNRAIRALWAHLACSPEDAPLLAEVFRRATAVGFTQWEAAADLLDAGEG